MADNKKKVIVYADWINKFEALTDEEAGRLIKHFFRYVNDLNPTSPDRITELSFIDIKTTLKRDLEKWEKKAEQSRENGTLGGRPKKTQENQVGYLKTNSVNSKPKKPDIDSVIVIDSVIDNVDNKLSINSDLGNKIDFDFFWNDYDKKVGEKEKIKKKWDKLSLNDQEKILDFIPKYKLSQPDKKFRKNPDTFLNNKSWNDEIIMPSSINQNKPISKFENTIKTAMEVVNPYK